MEREEEKSIQEDRPNPQLGETTTVDWRLASEEKFWDELMRGSWKRPMREDSEQEGKLAYWMKMDLETEEREAAAAACLSEDEDDDEPGFAIRRFRDRWNSLWSGADRFGDFEDTTFIPPMRYTDELPRDALSNCDTLQIFSAKVARVGEGLQWPLDVFGIVAIRDSVDQNRNIIFQRSSLNCQTLTEKDSNLVLTGPTRSVVLVDLVFIEVDLKVKGTSEDKILFSRVLQLASPGLHYSRLLQFTKISKFSPLEFTLGHIIFSVEATISVQIIDGSWPVGFHGEFAACTIDIDGKRHIVAGAESVNHKEIVLLSFGHEKGHVIDDGGEIKLSRRVVCVQNNSKLEVSMKAWQGDNTIVDRAGFTAEKLGKSYGKLEVASCKMEVTVAWSLISYVPELRKDTILENNRCSS
ncbi:hypothetical protein PR202_ga22626 [Eleusine coracana subsp. coracana]|uniref:DUF6598 domain-containing protein n=1 Tax=Eleusine coracana subsp. coracana TaxID=191504 RepID=A0AAV5D406_ELECO|nr:hypothetical protein PR202_ga22626 [Eleusine coracana subsp. coracana]